MLTSLKKRFADIHSLTFTSRSQIGSQMNWNMNGHGTVTVRVHDEWIDFDEIITLENGRVCHDKKRWRFSGSLLIFERYRNEQYEQIFEFSYQNGQFVPSPMYWCAPDEYRAELSCMPDAIVFTMTIHSERKNECLRYEYMAQ